jgi:asparagine synthase (glutamine-hydrolysing)
MTFSVGFADERFDEGAFQTMMVEHLHTAHRHLTLDAADIGRAFAEVVWFAERPITRTAPAPLLALAGVVHDAGFKVVLTGEGADEIFGGYNIFKEAKVRRFWALNPDSKWRGKLLSRLYGYVDRDPKTETFWRLFFKKGLEGTSDPFYSHRIRWANTEPLKRLFARDLQLRMQTEAQLLEELEAYLGAERRDWHPFCRAQHLEMALFMSGYLLSTQGDRMAMGRSVEGRVPFLDHRVIEFAARIPPKLKIRGLNEKYILKRAFADILPAPIVQRPKQPYRAPIASSFGPGQHNLATELLQRSELERAGVTEVAAVEQLLRKAASGVNLGEREEMALGLVTSTQLLHRLFVDKFTGASAARSI